MKTSTDPAQNGSSHLAEDARSSVAGQEPALIRASAERKAYAAETMPDWVVEAIASAEMDPRHDHLDEDTAGPSFPI